jgi:CBS domain-containing protein
VSTGPVFTSRLAGRPLLDKDELPVGRVQDTLILPTAAGEPPWVLGLVVTLHRRQIFVNIRRIAEISVAGAHLQGGTVDLRRFARRPGEMLASELYGQTAGDALVLDVGITPTQRQRGGWEVSVLALGHRRGLRRQTSAVVPWDKHPDLFKVGELAERLVQLRELHPKDLASAVLALSPTRKMQLAAALDDEQLADVLEQMSEEDQVRLLSGLGTERTADVVEEMEPDDAADLLAELPDDERERLLAAMENVQAADLRRLLRYGPATAGGLMTSHPLVVTPDATVAEVLARIRRAEVPPTAAVQVYVCEPPTATPTGRFLGTCGFQRLLRHPPGENVTTCIDETAFVRPELSDHQVALRMAGYDLMSVAVCDEEGHLLGAITVDDVLDRLLPADWRREEAG